jgi:small glutamine-rich tetratricopeptide repeat-containing protein alpha
MSEKHQRLITPEDIQASDAFRAEGNKHMSAKAYDKAIDSYTKAIELTPMNAVCYSNRAAAHSRKGDFTAAVADSEKAIQVNPKFVRSYSRLGCVTSSSDRSCIPYPSL